MPAPFGFRIGSIHESMPTERRDIAVIWLD
jgi:hypothetical protein